MDLIEGLMTTRAMRRYTAEPIADEEIVTCLRAALQAPSGGNIQPWQFLVVTDAEKRARLGEIYRRAYTRYEAAMLPTVPPFRDEKARAGFDRTVAASRHLADHMGESPVILLFLMPSITMTLSDEEGDLDVGTPYASLYPAVQNFMLAARGLGLGTALTTVHRIYQDEVRALFEIPDRFEIPALVPVGRPTGNFGVAPRKPLEKLTHWNTFGSRRDSL
jgi:nitroreductase